VDENHIAMFRWHPEGKNWQAMASISDTAHNAFTATITQLGTFALGCDAAPPEITILDPLDGSTNANPLPLISTLMTDAGSGIARIQCKCSWTSKSWQRLISPVQGSSSTCRERRWLWASTRSQSQRQM
jgi:hypothetical protein